MSEIISKIKVYLDTSVISYLEQNDAPEQRDITRKIWKSFKSGHLTASEIIAETQAETSDFIASLIKNGNVKLPPTSPYLHLMSN